MTTVIVVAFCAILGLLALLQLLLAVGLPLGRLAWGGQTAVLPARLRIASGASISAYAVFALIALDRAGLVRIFPTPVVSLIAMWVIAGYLLLSVLPNLVSKSKHERRTMVPVSLALATLATITAMS